MGYTQHFGFPSWTRGHSALSSAAASCPCPQPWLPGPDRCLGCPQSPGLLFRNASSHVAGLKSQDWIDPRGHWCLPLSLCREWPHCPARASTPSSFVWVVVVSPSKGHCQAVSSHLQRQGPVLGTTHDESGTEWSCPVLFDDWFIFLLTKRKACLRVCGGDPCHCEGN